MKIITALFACLFAGSVSAETAPDVAKTMDQLKRSYSEAKTFGGLIQAAQPLLTEEDIAFLKTGIGPLTNTLPAAKFDKNTITSHWGGKKIVLNVINPLEGKFQLNGQTMHVPLIRSAQDNLAIFQKALNSGHAWLVAFPEANAEEPQSASTYALVVSYASAVAAAITGKPRLPQDLPKMQKDCEEELKTDYGAIAQTRGRYNLREQMVQNNYCLLHAYIKTECTDLNACADFVKALKCYKQAHDKLRTHWRYDADQAKPIPAFDDVVK